MALLNIFLAGILYIRKQISVYNRITTDAVKEFNTMHSKVCSEELVIRYNKFLSIDNT
jgi:hypothetical protein